MKYLFFSTKILYWFAKNRRILPWRATKNPYYIWISEIILQQTRVEQAKSYYNKLIYNFPHIHALANAREDQVLKLWQGLGYYTRARNLHKGAKYIVKNHQAQFPATPDEMLNIPGIGKYTAAAIASIAFNYPAAAVDGNVYRVLSRFFNIHSPIDSAMGQKEFQKLADQLIDHKDPGDYNQALMEFGALQCIPKNPKCEICPLQKHCLAYAMGKVHELPVKKQKKAPKKRFFNYLIIQHDNHFYLKRRTENDIWRNLFEFPLIETNKETSIEQLTKNEQWQRLLGKNKIMITKTFAPVKHLLTHYTIVVNFIHISLGDELKTPGMLQKYSLEAIWELPVPRIIEKHMLDNLI